MTPEQFCYWLQGFGELGGTPPTPEQWKSINEHLATVFKKVTPQSVSVGPKPPTITSPDFGRPIAGGGYAGWPPGTTFPVMTC